MYKGYEYSSFIQWAATLYILANTLAKENFFEKMEAIFRYMFKLKVFLNAFPQTLGGKTLYK